jgi:hypothetical protein
LVDGVVNKAAQADTGYPMKTVGKIEPGGDGLKDVSIGTVAFDQPGLKIIRFMSNVPKQRLQIDRLQFLVGDQSPYPKADAAPPQTTKESKLGMAASRPDQGAQRRRSGSTTGDGDARLSPGSRNGAALGPAYKSADSPKSPARKAGRSRKTSWDSQDEWNRDKPTVMWVFPFIDKNSDGKIDSGEYQVLQEYKKKHRDWQDRARKELGLTTPKDL